MGFRNGRVVERGASPQVQLHAAGLASSQARESLSVSGIGLGPMALDVLGETGDALRLILDGLCEPGQRGLVLANVVQVVCGALKRAACPVGVLAARETSSSSLLAAASSVSPSTLFRGISHASQGQTTPEAIS